MSSVILTFNYSAAPRYKRPNLRGFLRFHRKSKLTLCESAPWFLFSLDVSNHIPTMYFKAHDILCWLQLHDIVIMCVLHTMVNRKTTNEVYGPLIIVPYLRNEFFERHLLERQMATQPELTHPTLCLCMSDFIIIDLSRGY